MPRSVIYAEIIMPLTRSWSHPTVINPIKYACVALTKDVGPLFGRFIH